MSNPYQAPKFAEQLPAVQRNPIRSYAEIALSFAAIIVLLAVTLFVVFSRAKFGHMFAEFEMKLPLITSCTLSLGFSVLLGALILITLIKEFVPSWRRVGIAWNVAMLVLAVVLLLTFLTGIFVPLMMLTTGLSR